MGNSIEEACFQSQQAKSFGRATINNVRSLRTEWGIRSARHLPIERCRVANSAAHLGNWRLESYLSDGRFRFVCNLYALRFDLSHLHPLGTFPGPVECWCFILKQNTRQDRLLLFQKIYITPYKLYVKMSQFHLEKELFATKKKLYKLHVKISLHVHVTN